MKAIWKAVSGEYQVIKKEGETITLAIPCTTFMNGKKVSYTEEQQLDFEEEYTITDTSPINKELLN